MCGDTEEAVVTLSGPKGSNFTQQVVLEQDELRLGYYRGSWDWVQANWKHATDIPPGRYEATFKIDGHERTLVFFVTTGGCDELEVLCAHNKYRAEVGVEPLVWDQKLAECAQMWSDWQNAQYNAGVIVDEIRPHADAKDFTTGGPLATCSKVCNTSVGQNLHQGGDSWTDRIDLFGKEKQCFQNQPYPAIFNGDTECAQWTFNNCKTYVEAAKTMTDEYERNKKTAGCAGHYSQIVWSETKVVGCGKNGFFANCFYCPPGNSEKKLAY